MAVVVIVLEDTADVERSLSVVDGAWVLSGDVKGTGDGFNSTTRGRGAQIEWTAPVGARAEDAVVPAPGSTITFLLPGSLRVSKPPRGLLPGVASAGNAGFYAGSDKANETIVCYDHDIR